jgi:predicted  nucleic acid-binding Zn-ribbon protein
LYRKYKRQYTQEVDKIKQELFDAEFAREEVLESISSELITIYNDIKKRKKGIAVAMIKNGICSGCRMSLPVATISEARKCDAIIICENCGRILYTE